MKIHNQMEDLVHSIVDEMYDSKDVQEQEICTCSQCRLDVACFVLNRISPEYIISSRGVAHLKSDYHNSVQKSADVVQLVKKGLEIVSRKKRPGFTHDDHLENTKPEEATFNFPVISGRLFNGQNFVPLLNQKVVLYIDGKEVKMFDQNWQNPYTIVSTIPGNFMFWPESISAKECDEKKRFSFRIGINDSDYSEFSYRFDLEVTSDSRVVNSLQVNNTYNLKDLYIFKNDFEEKEELEP